MNNFKIGNKYRIEAAVNSLLIGGSNDDQDTISIDVEILGLDETTMSVRIVDKPLTSGNAVSRNTAIAYPGCNVNDVVEITYTDIKFLDDLDDIGINYKR